jgi:hypothetical protein
MLTESDKTYMEVMVLLAGLERMLAIEEDQEAGLELRRCTLYVVSLEIVRIICQNHVSLSSRYAAIF